VDTEPGNTPQAVKSPQFQDYPVPPGELHATFPHDAGIGQISPPPKLYFSRLHSPASPPCSHTSILKQRPKNHRLLNPLAINPSKHPPPLLDPEKPHKPPVRHAHRPTIPPPRHRRPTKRRTFLHHPRISRIMNPEYLVPGVQHNELVAGGGHGGALDALA
jgi:hypothetical protein